MRKNKLKTKTQQAKDLLDAGNTKEGLRILSTFTMGLDRQEQAIIKRGYECLVRPDFYRSLGFYPAECVERAVAIARNKILKVA
jgi:hypothetical protein